MLISHKNQNSIGRTANFRGRIMLNLEGYLLLFTGVKIRFKKQQYWNPDCGYRKMVVGHKMWYAVPRIKK
jgi:hypothetical protein